MVGVMSASASLTDLLAFLRLCVSLADTEIDRCLTPAASARSSPALLRIRAV